MARESRPTHFAHWFLYSSAYESWRGLEGWFEPDSMEDEDVAGAQAEEEAEADAEVERERSADAAAGEESEAGPERDEG